MKEKLHREICISVNNETVQKALAFVDSCLADAEIHSAKSSRLKIAADEICSNTVYYSSATSLWLHFSLQENKIIFEFSDNGTPFNPLFQKECEANITATAEDRKIGGLGILLVKRLMDDVHYHYTNGQNILTLVLII